MEGYRRNIDVLITNKDREFVEKETLIFNEYIDKFSHFYKDEIDEGIPSLDTSDPDMSDTVPIIDSAVQSSKANGDTSSTAVEN